MISAARLREGRTREDLLALLGLAVLAGTYFVVRYGGQWAEADTGLMAHATRVVAQTQQLAPVNDGVYSNGYGYQVVSTAIMAFTGLDIQTLQQMVYPLVAAFLVLPAWVLYRELTGSARAASLATLLLLLVPEHLFAIFRGSHERLDRAFVFTALWLLIRSIRLRGDRGMLVTHVGLVLLASWGLIATNALFGMSFVAALATACLLSWIGLRGPAGVRPFARETTPLLVWAAVGAAALLLVFIAFVYPPFASALGQLLSIPERLIVLITSGGSGFDPYAALAAGWVSPTAFLVLSVMNFVLLVSSVAIWVAHGWAWLRGGKPASTGMWLLWLLYAAFAVQGAAGIVSDRTGALQGNVQYRLFALFAPFAVPLVADAIVRWRPGAWPRRVLAGAFALTTVLALTKATLDPTLSNKWLFYSNGEIDALRWADAHQQKAKTWLGPDDRLESAYELEVGYPVTGNDWVSGEPTPDITTVVISDAVVGLAARIDATIPSLAGRNLVYDDGDTQLYR
jgi:hypothetical protein